MMYTAKSRGKGGRGKKPKQSTSVEQSIVRIHTLAQLSWLLDAVEGFGGLAILVDSEPTPEQAAGRLSFEQQWVVRTLTTSNSLGEEIVERFPAPSCIASLAVSTSCKIIARNVSVALVRFPGSVMTAGRLVNMAVGGLKSQYSDGDLRGNMMGIFSRSGGNGMKHSRGGALHMN